MKNWKYAVWTVLLLELVVFGKNEKAYWIFGGFILLFIIVHLITDRKPAFKRAKGRIQRANPLPVSVWKGVLIFLSLIAIVLPYLTGEINPLLCFFAASAWVMFND